MPRRQILVVLVLALATGLGLSTPPFDLLRGLSLDLLTGLRWHGFGDVHPPDAAPVVVVAVDEATYRTPPFEGTPATTWTRELAQVLNDIVEGGATVVGLDIIFPVSIEELSLPFGDQSLGARLRGFDRDWLRALASAARDGKVVLGQVQHRDRPIQPSAGQRAAVGHQRNIRALNIWSDPDDVVRRLPLSFVIDGQRVPSMAVELASRTLRQAPQWDAGGALHLGDYRVPAAVPDTMTLNFAGGADGIPTYSLADLRACGVKGDRAFFNRAFAGKVVLIGTLLDVEDRKLTSKRFATAPEGAHAPRCSPAPMIGDAPARQTIAGVYIHATAIANLLRRDAVVEWRWPAIAALSVFFAGLAVAAAFALSPLRALAAWAVLLVAWLAIATIVFRSGLALPTLQPLAAALAALVLAIGYRTTIVDRDKRLLRQSFALYLAPAIIDRMLASNRPPRLGGELRQVTIYFSDVAGFSARAERLQPDEVVALMNTYLSAMTEIIESEGGFVDKYIGDAIVAVFGAPADDPQHAAAATRAALRCQRRLAGMNAPGGAFAGRPLGQRIGLNTGEVLVGNIGSHRRFNYTVMGDAVNLASRLEGANKRYGTTIIAADATMAAAGAGFAWRELDDVRVRGREGTVRIHEPLGEGATPAAMAGIVGRYAEGLAAWRAGRFAEAAGHFAVHAGVDQPSARFCQRATSEAATTRAADWEPVTDLTDR